MGKLLETLGTFFSASYKRTIGIVFLLVLAISVPVTLTLVSQQQETRQRAAETCPRSRDYYQCGGSCQGVDYTGKSVLVKETTDCNGNKSWSCSWSETCNSGCNSSTGLCNGTTSVTTRSYNQCGGNCDGTTYGASETEGITEYTNSALSGSKIWKCNSHTPCSGTCNPSTGTCGSGSGQCPNSDLSYVHLVDPSNVAAYTMPLFNDVAGKNRIEFFPHVDYIMVNQLQKQFAIYGDYQAKRVTWNYIWGFIKRKDIKSYNPSMIDYPAQKLWGKTWAQVKADEQAKGIALAPWDVLYYDAKVCSNISIHPQPCNTPPTYLCSNVSNPPPAPPPSGGFSCDVNSSGITSSSISLSITPNTTPSSSGFDKLECRIYDRSTSGPWKVSSTTASSATSCSFTGLKPSTQYTVSSAYYQSTNTTNKVYCDADTYTTTSGGTTPPPTGGQNPNYCAIQLVNPGETYTRGGTALSSTVDYVTGAAFSNMSASYGSFQAARVKWNYAMRGVATSVAFNGTSNLEYMSQRIFGKSWSQVKVDETKNCCPFATLNDIADDNMDCTAGDNAGYTAPDGTVYRNARIGCRIKSCQNHPGTIGDLHWTDSAYYPPSNLCQPCWRTKAWLPGVSCSTPIPANPYPKCTTTPPAGVNKIAGYVFVDTNRNGRWDATTGEKAFTTGATIVLSGKASNSTKSISIGRYEFSALAAGNYTVKITLPTGYVATTSTTVSKTLPPDPRVDFGIVPATTTTGTPPTGTPPSGCPNTQYCYNRLTEIPAGLNTNGSQNVRTAVSYIMTNQFLNQFAIYGDFQKRRVTWNYIASFIKRGDYAFNYSQDLDWVSQQVFGKAWSQVKTGETSGSCPLASWADQYPSSNCTASLHPQPCNTPPSYSCAPHGTAPGPIPDGTFLAMSLKLPGIGSAKGDNKTPKNPTRAGSVSVFNTSNVQVKNIPSTSFTFDSTTSTFKGNVNLAILASGYYYIKVKLENTLTKQFPDIQNLVANQKNTISKTLVMIPGDFNGNNQLILEDYNIYVSTYKACAKDNNGVCRVNQSKKAEKLADLNDDGIIDGLDLNILIGSFEIRQGD